METLLALDHTLFLLVYNFPHTVPLYTVALILSGIGAGGLIWLVLSIWLFFREEKRDHWFFVPVAFAGSLSLLLTNFILKSFFSRNRPPGASMNDFSFPSGHATIAWALAFVLAKKEPRAAYVFYLLAFFISLSRIYLGKHYPADVVAGSALGLAIGYMVQYAYAKIRHTNVKRKRTSNHRGGSRRGSRH